MDLIKEFHLVRVEDETGISGTGVVARGVIMPSGVVVMEWQTFHSSICFYKNIGDIESIHGHNGKTLVVMGAPRASTLVDVKKPHLTTTKLPSGYWAIYDADTGTRRKQAYRTRNEARTVIEEELKQGVV